VAHLRAERFDFTVDRHTAVFVCKRVIEGADLLRAVHDDDGDWQFLCGDMHEEDGDDTPVIVCLECLVARHPDLNQVADLEPGMAAERPSGTASWDGRDASGTAQDGDDRD
jgi:hypothetical protein